MSELDWLRMTPLERERVELRYVRASDPDFATNLLTDALHPGEDEHAGPPPRVTFYAQPAGDAGPLALEAVPAWLKSAERRYEPRKDLPLVPETHRGFADGLLAANDFRSIGRYPRFLAIRRTGTVEYAPYCTWTVGVNAGEVVWLLQMKLEDRFQLELTYTGEPSTLGGVVRSFAARFDLAFGQFTPRVYDRTGDAAGSINCLDVQYL